MTRRDKTKHHEGCECCEEGREAFLSRVENNIKQFGLAIISTYTETPAGALPFSYTIGLTDKGLSEIIVFGLPQQVAHSILNDAAKMLIEGNLPASKKIDKLLQGYSVIFRHVSAAAAADYIIQANGRAGRQLDALQMVWPDTKGAFPWEDGFEPKFRSYQPSLYAEIH